MAKQPVFFPAEADFRRWMQTYHTAADELLVGFWKKCSGKPSIDWPQARDQALCFGWIDGVRRSLGDDAYTIRFTPRRRGSVWSKVNVERFRALEAEGQMTSAGKRAFEAGKEHRACYSYESERRELAPDEERQFKANPAAWANWEKWPPGYRRRVLQWVTSAKRPTTRARRLAILIEDSAAGRKVGVMQVGKKT